MTTEGGRTRRWLRPLGLFLVALGLAVGQPMVTVFVSFALLTLVAPGKRIAALALAAIAFALVFSGSPTGGLWYVERGWAILIGGAFAAVTLVWPGGAFFPRALWALGIGTGAAALVLALANGWAPVEGLVLARIDESVQATLQWTAGLADGVASAQLGETVRQTGELQGVLFPALVALSTLASLGVGWWLHVRLTGHSDRGLHAFRDFRFPDPLVWLLVVGVSLVLVTEWSVGWGRAGTNLMAFMGALYILRGLGVLFFFLGGVSVLGGILFLLALVLAAPVLLAGAFVIGMGDSWLDLRSRAALVQQGTSNESD